MVKSSIYSLYTGHDDYSRQCNDVDLQLCCQYACGKPPPTSREFATLAEIIMDEENLQGPRTPKEALELYFDLLNNIVD